MAAGCDALSFNFSALIAVLRCALQVFPPCADCACMVMVKFVTTRQRQSQRVGGRKNRKGRRKWKG
jgi:hypothetical protein